MTGYRLKSIYTTQLLWVLFFTIFALFVMFCSWTVHMKKFERIYSWFRQNTIVMKQTMSYPKMFILLRCIELRENFIMYECRWPLREFIHSKLEYFVVLSTNKGNRRRHRVHHMVICSRAGIIDYVIKCLPWVCREKNSFNKVMRHITLNFYCKHRETT